MIEITITYDAEHEDTWVSALPDVTERQILRALILAAKTLTDPLRRTVR